MDSAGDKLNINVLITFELNMPFSKVGDSKVGDNIELIMMAGLAWWVIVPISGPLRYIHH